MRYLFKVSIVSLLFVGAWGAGYSAGKLVDSYGFGEHFVYLLLAIAVLASCVYWYLKKSGTERKVLRSQGTLFTTMTGISVVLFVLLQGIRRFSFMFAGWEVRLKMKDPTEFIVFFAAFILVAAILSIMAWVKYRTAPAPAPAPAAGATP